ncbi:hypothetical protein OG21DRAFT_1374859, partial [Imleria badia]
RLWNVQYSEDDLQFSDEDRDLVTIVENKIFKHKVLRVNYTMYDLRREQDSVTLRTHPDVMVLSQETDKQWHPYWYAHILQIFQVNVRYYGDQTGGEEIRRFNILFICWFGRNPDLQSGFRARRLPKVGFLHEDNPDAFGFLNPDNVIRGVHLISSFANGLTEELLGPSFIRPIENDNKDWCLFDVNIFADRDMFMRFRGSGIGHVASRHWDMFLHADGNEGKGDPETNRDEEGDGI